MSSFRQFTRSLAFIASCLFKKSEYDILFYYPAYFNRGEKGENRFFEPFYSLCKKNGLRYLVLEEPVLFKKPKRNSHATPFDLPFVLILLLRKVIPLGLFKSFQHRDWFIAKLLRPILFYRLRFRNFIVLSNSMHGFFRGLEPEANLYDYQHGIIFSKHSGYLTENGRTQEHIKLNGSNLLLYGEGFQKALSKNNLDGYYKSHTFIIGAPAIIEPKRANIKESKTILFSLQFTGDGEFSEHEDDWRDYILNLLDKNSDFFEKNGLHIVFKHHPRFNNSIDLSPLESFSFTSFSTRDIGDLLDESFLHITFYSTSIFDASAKGVPTIAWQHDYSLANIFTDDFEYPLGVTKGEKIADIIERYLKDEKLYMQDSKSVREWYDSIYSPFSEKLFKTLFVKDGVCHPKGRCTPVYSVAKKSFATMINISHRIGLNEPFYRLNSNKQIILTYHNIIPDDLFDDTLHLGVSHTVSTFEAQLLHLKKRFSFTTELGVPNSCILTFDDGFANNYEVVMPILKKHEIEAIFFIPLKSLLKKETLWIDRLLLWLSYAPANCYDLPSFKLCFDDTDSRRSCLVELMRILREDYSKKESIMERLEKLVPIDSMQIDKELYRLRFEPMKLEEVEKLKEMGHKVGCHSYSHENLSLLDTESLIEEIKIAQSHLGTIFNTDIYSYPFGGPEEVSPPIIQMLKKSDFSYGVTNINHETDTITFGRYSLPRFTLPNRCDAPTLDAALSGLEYFLRYKKMIPDIAEML